MRPSNLKRHQFLLSFVSLVDLTPLCTIFLTLWPVNVYFNSAFPCAKPTTQEFLDFAGAGPIVDQELTPLAYKLRNCITKLVLKPSAVAPDMNSSQA